MTLKRNQVLGGMLAAALLAGWSSVAAEPIVWDFTKEVKDWGAPFGMMLIQEDDGLVMDVNAPDSRIAARSLAIPCADYKTMRITYCAEGFSEDTDGELFYGTDKFPGIEGNRYFPIGYLLTDGKPHTLTVDLTGWRDHGTVNVMRLDLVNQAPGEIRLIKIELIPYQK